MKNALVEALGLNRWKKKTEDIILKGRYKQNWALLMLTDFIGGVWNKHSFWVWTGLASPYQ